MRKSSQYNWGCWRAGDAIPKEDYPEVVPWDLRSGTCNQSNQWFNQCSYNPCTGPLYTFSPGLQFFPVSYKDISTSSKMNQLSHHHQPMHSRERAMLEKLWDRYHHPAAAQPQPQPTLFPPVNSIDFQMQEDSWCLRTNLAVAGLDHGWLLAWKFIHTTWEYNTWHKICRGCHTPIPDKDTAVTDGRTRCLSC